MVIVAMADLDVTDAKPALALNASLEQHRKLQKELFPLPVTPVTSNE